MCLGSLPLGEKAEAGHPPRTPHPSLVQPLEIQVSRTSTRDGRLSFLLPPPTSPAPRPTVSLAIALPASLGSCPGSISSAYSLGTSSSLPSSLPSSPPFPNHSFVHTTYFSGTPCTPHIPGAHNFLGRKIPSMAFDKGSQVLLSDAHPPANTNLTCLYFLIHTQASSSQGSGPPCLPPASWPIAKGLSPKAFPDSLPILSQGKVASS